ncbi:MAG: DUF3575 domain-containing protein [Bacteroidota bacterium]
MKNIFSFFTTVLLVVALQQNLFAQNSPKFMNSKDDKELFNNSIKMNLMNAAFSYPSFALERRVSDHVSFQLDGIFRMGGNSNTASSSFTNNGKSIQSFSFFPAVRYYFYENQKMKIENYFSVYYKYRNFQSKNDLSNSYNPNGINYSNTYTEVTNGAGLLLGLQTSRSSHFVFDLFFGTQIQRSSGTWNFYDKNATLNDFKTNYSLSSVSDAFSFMNSSSLRAGFTIGVRF